MENTGLYTEVDITVQLHIFSSFLTMSKDMQHHKVDPAAE